MSYRNLRNTLAISWLLCSNIAWSPQNPQHAPKDVANTATTIATTHSDAQYAQVGNQKRTNPITRTENITIFENVGGGQGDYKDKVGDSYHMRSLTAGNNINLTLSDDENEINIIVKDAVRLASSLTASSLAISGTTTLNNVIATGSTALASLAVASTATVNLNGLDVTGTATVGQLNNLLKATNGFVQDNAQLQTADISNQAITLPKINPSAATFGNTPNTLVLRDGSGSVAAGTVGATQLAVNGNATINGITTLSATPTGMLAVNNGVVYTGGIFATDNITDNAITLPKISTSAKSTTNTPDTLVLRDGSGNFSADSLTTTGLKVNGNASLANAKFGTITGLPRATAGVVGLGTVNTSDFVDHAVTVAKTAATPNNTPNTLVLRNGSANFSANVITANQLSGLTGINKTSAISTQIGNSTNHTGVGSAASTDYSLQIIGSGLFKGDATVVPAEALSINITSTATTATIPTLMRGSSCTVKGITNINTTGASTTHIGTDTNSGAATIGSSNKSVNVYGATNVIIGTARINVTGTANTKIGSSDNHVGIGSAPNVNYKLTVGGNTLIAGQPILTTAWSIYNVGLGYQSIPAADTRYIYFVQMNSRNIIRFDTTNNLDDASSWTTLNLGAFGGDYTNITGFTAATKADKYIYCIPTFSSSWTVRYDTTKDFTASESWEIYNMDPSMLTGTGFFGGVHAGNYIYYIPYENRTLYWHDTTKALNDVSAWHTLTLSSDFFWSAGCRGGVFDGRYLYLVPSYADGSYSGNMLRFDTTADMAETTYNLPDYISASAQGFSGGVFDGRYIYLSPSYPSSPLAVCYDTQAPFTTASSWSTFDISTINSNANNFNGAVYDGNRYVYFVPSPYQLGGYLARYDNTQAFSTPSAWFVTNIASFYGFDEARSFGGGIWANSALYLAPYTYTYVTRFDPESYHTLTIGATDITKPDNWSSYNLDLSAMATPATAGTYIYSASGSSIVRLNKASNFSDAGAWTILNIHSFGGNYPHFYNPSAAVQAGNYIYFIPTDSSSWTVRYDTTKDFTSSSSWEIYDLYNQGPSGSGFSGGVCIGNNVYYTPHENRAVFWHDSTHALDDPDSWYTLTLTDYFSTNAGSSGGIYDGRYLYLVPQYRDGFPSGLVVRMDTTAGMAASAYDIAAHVGEDAVIFYGGTFDGRYIYFAPNYYNITVRYDTLAAFTDANSWTTFNTTTANPNACGFRTVTYDGNRYIYYAPYYNHTLEQLSGYLIRYDTTQPFASTNAWTAVNIAAFPGFSTAKGFFGGIYTDALYLMPGSNTLSLRFMPQAGNLAVTGAASITGSINLIDSNINKFSIKKSDLSTTFSIRASTGNTYIAGTLEVGNATTPCTTNSLVVHGKIKASSAIETGASCAVSDARIKRDIHTVDIKQSLGGINNLRPVSFNFDEWWRAHTHSELKKQVGFIAQELQKQFPELVSPTSEYRDGQQLLGIDYSRIMPILVASTQALSKKVTKLKSEIAVLQAKNGRQAQ